MSRQERLIQEHIEDDPHRPGPAQARLKEYGTEVWALLSYLQLAVGNDVERAAEDFGIPREVIDAALAYY
jgi:uncharacterized protein (DUF433 family)